MAYRFLTDCVSCKGKDVDRLIRMVDDEMQITRRTFLKYVSWKELLDLMPFYARHPSQGLTLAGDWYVSYHRSKWDGRRCYYLKHSGIEYIWIQRGDGE